MTILSIIRSIFKSIIPTYDFIDKNESNLLSYVKSELFTDINSKRLLLSYFFYLIIMGFNLISIYQISATIFFADLLWCILLAILLGRTPYQITKGYFISPNYIREHFIQFAMKFSSYWRLYALSMITVAFLHLHYFRRGRYFLITCAVFVFIPLFPKNAYIKFAIGTITTYLMMLLYMMYIYLSKQDVENGFIFIHLLLLGCLVFEFLGLIFQGIMSKLWMISEYVRLSIYVDPLTDLLNRRGAEQLLKENVTPKTQNIGTIMCDIDYFKLYNDIHGHDSGDECLKAVSNAIYSVAKKRTNMVIRHGGEEFIILVVNTTKQELLDLAEAIRTAVIATKFKSVCPQLNEFVTISLGASIKSIDGPVNYSSLISEADAALYLSKDHGRNRTTYFKNSEAM